ncbi:helix-turn-helix domain-containing protein [Lysobacter sp. CA199]|uniref:helix-turn-helix domain-containing protein n=1 Tax=Lysobacter sp. CA199 TaxID=3455608 RepID=UPI003F8D4298
MAKDKTSTSGISSAGQRVLRVFKALKGYSIEGISNGDLARGLNESPANVSRALATLIEEGLAIKLDNGRFAHSVQTLQIAFAHASAVERIQSRISEFQQRLAAGLNR